MFRTALLRQLGTMHVLRAEMEGLEIGIGLQSDSGCYCRAAGRFCLRYSKAVCQWYGMAGLDDGHNCVCHADLRVHTYTVRTDQAAWASGWR